MTTVDPKLDIDAFLRAARAPAPVSEDGKHAVRTRLQETLGVAASAWPRVTAPHQRLAGALEPRIRFGWKAPLLVAAGFGLGLAAHGAIDAASVRRPVAEQAEQATVVASSVAASTPTSARESLPSRAEAVLPAESLPMAPSVRSDAPLPAPRSEPPIGAARGDLAAEELLLETARTALERRDPMHALEALEHHARRFPRGQLREERESLRIGALVAAGNTSEARARTVEFHRAFPESLQGRALDALLESAP
jgi:hypothetical protein